jgi:DNA/RNA-binding domain of Phe-tRNA-synthetase-like protein
VAVRSAREPLGPAKRHANRLGWALLLVNHEWQARGAMRLQLDHPTLRVALVTAEGVQCGASNEELLELMRAAEERVRADASVFSEAVRVEIRNVLRAGGYKPTGRGKPASEFLLGAARAEGLPRVNNLVDINNLVSLKTALPLSIFDRRQLGGDVSIRFGRPGEKYVFNNSGQEMDVGGIPVVCRLASDEPVGNAVKDSMLAKVGTETREVLAVVYGSRRLPPAHLELATEQLANLLETFAGATRCETSVVPS